MHPYLQRIFPLGGGSPPPWRRRRLVADFFGSSWIYRYSVGLFLSFLLLLFLLLLLLERSGERVLFSKTKDVLIAGNRPSGNHL